MNWVASVIKNKLVIYILAVTICLLGIFCLIIIPISPFPSPKSNRIDIQFSYPGANAQTVQTQVTKKVVDALQSVNNIQSISANSSASASRISLVLDSTSDQQVLQTQIAIMQAIASSHLPASVPQPKITRQSGESGLLYFMVFSDRMSLFDIGNFLQSTLSPKFSSLPGVSVATSAQPSIVKIQLIPEKLAFYHLSPSTISQQIDNNYQSTPLGALYLNGDTYPLNLKKPAESLMAFDHMIVGTQKDNTKPIYLKDIATISFQPRDVVANSYTSFNGHLSDIIALYTTSRANPFTISKTTKDYVATLKKDLPSWLNIIAVQDSADTMHTSINEVIFTIAIASLLVLLIALIFLGHLRTTLIPIVTIPICLLGSIVFVNALGYSVNILTLLAMVIAVGLVVDDAIVVVENITRHIEQGMPKYDAIIQGTSSIAFTVLGITATLLAVYLLIAFSSGPFILFLKNFTVPLSAAVFISGFLALTLTPVMCVALMSDHKPNAYQIRFEALLKVIIDGYQRALKTVIRTPKSSLSVIILLIAAGTYFTLKLPEMFFPSDPNGSVVIFLNSTTQDSVNSLRKKAETFKPFYTMKQVQYYRTEVHSDPISGSLSGMITLHYKPQYLHQNIHFADQINAFIRQHHITNTQARIQLFLTEGQGPDLGLSIYGGKTVSRINHEAKKLTALLKKSPMLSLVNNTINQPHKQLEFEINSAKAARFGLFRQQIAQLLSNYYGGYTLSNNFSITGLSVPVVVQLGKEDLQNPTSIQKLQIQSPTTGLYYPLADFVTLKTVARPLKINTHNNQPSVHISANLAKGHSLGEAIHFINAQIAQNMPDLHYQYTGNAKQFLDSSHVTSLIIILGLISIYFILAILFRSLMDPFIILLTVPFSVIGGALSLYIVSGSLNLFSVLGLITLIGLITKHGVLIVRFANQELQTGASAYDAIITATHHRFRPIIMTTLAMAFGSLPLILSQELMYVARQALGVTIFGGLIIGTFFSLFIVPLIYTIVKRGHPRTLPMNQPKAHISKSV